MNISLTRNPLKFITYRVPKKVTELTLTRTHYCSFASAHNDSWQFRNIVAYKDIRKPKLNDKRTLVDRVKGFRMMNYIFQETRKNKEKIHKSLTKLVRRSEFSKPLRVLFFHHVFVHTEFNSSEVFFARPATSAATSELCQNQMLFNFFSYFSFLIYPPFYLLFFTQNFLTHPSPWHILSRFAISGLGPQYTW